MRRAIEIVGVLVVLLALTACKKYKPEPSCQETVQVFEHNGQRVFQSLNGIYLKESFPIWACASKPDSKDPYQRKFVNAGRDNFYWREGKLFTTKEYAALLREGKWSKDYSPFVPIRIKFGTEEWDKKIEPSIDWWFQPAIPHKLYPLDLLPNFGLDAPDPNAGIGPIKTKPTVYWAVRGTKNAASGFPNTTFCSMKSPPERYKNDYSLEATKARDIAWLIQAKTYEEDMVGNTCRGYVSADNGKSIAAMVDVPGVLVKDIDKIYKALARHLSELTVE